MKIALAGPYPAGTLERFQALLPNHTIQPIATQEEYEALTDVECVIVRVLKTPEAVLANKPNLKAVIRWGAGYDSVDIQAAGRRGILVLNTPGVNAYAVAELALGMMIILNRKVLGYWNNAQQGNWDRGAFSSLSLNHKTVGIVGGGNIGRRVAALVQASRGPGDLLRRLPYGPGAGAGAAHDLCLSGGAGGAGRPDLPPRPPAGQHPPHHLGGAALPHEAHRLPHQYRPGRLDRRRGSAPGPAGGPSGRSRPGLCGG